MHSEGIHQDLSLGLHRSDYMLHAEDGVETPKQIELNTIAASFAGLSTALASIHATLMGRYATVSSLVSQAALPGADLPPNGAVSGLAAALAAADKAYDVPKCVSTVNAGTTHVYH